MNVPADEENAGPRAPRKPNRTRLFGIVLLVAAILFWVAALVLGREVVRRYRRFLDPRSLFGKGLG
jgi:hypothetical protein